LTGYTSFTSSILFIQIKVIKHKNKKLNKKTKTHKAQNTKTINTQMNKTTTTKKTTTNKKKKKQKSTKQKQVVVDLLQSPIIRHIIILLGIKVLSFHYIKFFIVAR
jgi:hypothetical protein